MHIDAHLGFSVVPLETEDEIDVLVELTAPPPDDRGDRPPATLEVVLDRSGSMSGPPLAGAQRALLGLVDRLDPADNFGLVSFDDTARVEIPAGPLADKAAARRAIAALNPGGSTDLSSGLLRGVQEARRVVGESGATLLLISDGHANLGIVDDTALAGIASDALRHRVSTTALGYGLGYDERLMAAVADGGAGSALHAEDPDTAGRLIATEVEHLLAKVVQAASLTIVPRPPVTSVSLYGGLPASALPDGSVLVELGDFYGGECRKLLLSLAVPGIATLGLATIADIRLTCFATQTLTTYTADVPVTVNVVPGDEAAGRVPDPVVRAERLFQDVQDAKRRASDALIEGDVERAIELLDSTASTVKDALSWVPDPDELAQEAQELDIYKSRVRRDANRTSKTMRSSSHLRNRKRGRPGE
ncbi:vWA domain-containing protein [Microbispora amethystogenes]|uniref:VWFA domain-containing protein n=1 Tax=Microbispora amethystogenes TaxID=1427754 RepID=A0ABQ4F4Y0_9ACTN|nr:VWA domain-containing protein [Microbispora amethystogenes]GIH29872.1 hypothetical protein Mam01_00360 [Microbispora amethystogenes]